MKKVLLIAVLSLVFISPSWAAHSKPACVFEKYGNGYSKPHGYHGRKYHSKRHGHGFKCDYWCHLRKAQKKRNKHQYKHAHRNPYYGYKKHVKKYYRYDPYYAPYSRVTIGSHDGDGYFNVSFGGIFD